MKSQRPKKPGALRRAAEARLKAMPVTSQPATEADPRRLQHEVEVHQIELEMQNEELRATHARLEARLAQYTDLYDFAPACYFLLARDSKIRQANLAGTSLLGIERSRLLKQRFAGLVATEARSFFGDLLARAFESKTPQSGVVTLSIAGKPRLTVLLQASVMRDDQECRVVMTDLTERTAADEAFHLAQQRLALNVDQTPLAVMEFDVEGRVREWNSAATAVFGYSREEVIGQPWRFIVPAALHGQVESIWASIVGQRGGKRSTNDNITKAGRTITCEWFNTPLISRDGRTIGVASLIEDITERKQAQEALRKSRAVLDAINEGTTNLICVKDRQGKVIMANPAMCRFLGKIESELLGQDDLLVFTDADLARQIRETDCRVMDSRCSETVEETIRLPDGQRTCLFTKSPYLDARGDVIGLIGIGVDITERKRTEEALRAGEEQLRAMFEMASIGIAQADPKTGRWLSVNPKMCEITGYSASELLQMGLADITQAEDRQPDWEAFQRVVRGEARDYRMERRYVRKDGSLAWVNVNMTVLRDLAGQPTRTMATIEDVTERKSAEAALRQQEKHFRALTEGATDVTTLLDADGTMRFQSPSLEQVFGYPPDELVGRSAFEFIHPDDLARVQQALAELTATPGATTRIEFRFRHKDGSWRVLEAAARHLLDDPNVKGVVVNSRDNTERQRLEEALRESEGLLRESQAIAGLGSYVQDIPTGRWKSSEVLDQVFGIDAAYDRSVAGWAALIHSEDRAIMLDYFKNEVLARRQSFDKEYRIIRPSDQAVRWVHGLGRLEFDPEGPLRKMVGTIQDITERKQAEAALRLGKRAIDAATEGICITKSAATGSELVYVNRGFERLTGYRAEEVLGRNMRFLQGAETSPAAVDSLRAAVQAGEACTLELLNYRKDGTRFWNRVYITPVADPAGAITHFVAILDDVTWGKEAEIALRDLNQFKEEIITSAQEGIVVYGPDLKYKVWNPYMERLTGYSAAQVLGKTPLGVFPFLSKTGLPAAWSIALAGGPPIRLEFEYHLPPTGQSGWSTHTIGPLRDSQGKVVGILALVRDITERKRSEAELRVSEVRYRRLFEAAKDGVLILDAEMAGGPRKGLAGRRIDNFPLNG